MNERTRKIINDLDNALGAAVKSYANYRMTEDEFLATVDSLSQDTYCYLPELPWIEQKITKMTLAAKAAGMIARLFT